MAEHTLILLRHAKSDWSGDEPDVRRPLAKRGRRQAPEAGQWLAEHVDAIDLAVVSPAVRAQTTWELVSAELGEVPDTVTDDRVYAVSAPDLLPVVRGLPEDCRTAVLVGHNPGLEDLTELLTGRWAHLVTSALAVVTLTGSWADAGDRPGELVTSGRPPV
jgi:phosphohistidine phosphatase